ncbi:MAG: CD1871A family CXXC motif-containing protein [Clostridiaceae bacterium]|nr:CD1871A family CXXC motif-containing protein [Clostridiaceae bacterium]
MNRRRFIWLSAGVLLLAIGLWRNETLFVWQRAVQICLGCIGIG